MTVFGNRDFAPTDPIHVAPRAERPSPTSRRCRRSYRLPVSSDTRRVVIKVRGGEEIEVGRVEGREPAVRIARDTIRMIESAQTADEWPTVGDRFLRPDAIVSIDVQRADD